MTIKPGPKPKKQDGTRDKRRRVTPENKPKHPPLKPHKHKKQEIKEYQFSQILLFLLNPRRVMMSDQTELTIASKESVALEMARDIANREELYAEPSTYREKFLDLYVECLKATSFRREK